MDEAGQKAARRRAMISFIAAGVLVVVSVVGLIGVDRRNGRWDRPGLDRIEHRMGEMGPGRTASDEDGRQDGKGGGQPWGGESSRPAFPGGPGGAGAQGGGRSGDDQQRPDDSGRRNGDGSTTTSSTTTTTAPTAGI